MEGMETVTASLRRLAPLALATVLAAVAPAAPRESAAPADGADALLQRLVAAWQDQDHEALAALLDPDGAAVTLVRHERPDLRTTPAQAHYVFKTLFQATDGHALAVVSTTRHGDKANAVLEWRYRRGESRFRERLFVSLRRGEGWRVVAIRPGS